MKKLFLFSTLLFSTQIYCEDIVEKAVTLKLKTDILQNNLVTSFEAHALDAIDDCNIEKMRNIIEKKVSAEQATKNSLIAAIRNWKEVVKNSKLSESQKKLNSVSNMKLKGLSFICLGTIITAIGLPLTSIAYYNYKESKKENIDKLLSAMLGSIGLPITSFGLFYITVGTAAGLIDTFSNAYSKEREVAAKELKVITKNLQNLDEMEKMIKIMPASDIL